MNNKSPLRYPGGKTRACKLLEKIILEYFNLTEINTVLSPFLGGGSFEFYLQNKYNLIIVANDKFKPLYNFWKCCKNKNTELCADLKTKLGIDKVGFNAFRKSIMTESDQFKQAVQYFVINRCSFSGATLSGGFSKQSSEKRFTKSSIDRVSNLNLSKFDIYNEDFKDFIVKQRKDKQLMFLDPPYYLEKASKLYGKDGDMHEGFDHDGLYKLLSKQKGWILTYNNCDWIKNKYKEFIILDDISWSYGMNKSKASSELIIISPST